MEPIVPRSVIQRRARDAVEAGQPAEACPWPLGSEAGQLYQREHQAELQMREASRRAGEGVRAATEKSL
jgi:hypothetical protein